MKIMINENNLNKIVNEAANDWLNDALIMDSWVFAKEYIVTEGLTCSYNIGKLKSILLRKYSNDLDANKVTINGIDFNRTSKTTHRDVMNGFDKKDNNNFKTTQDTDNWMCLQIDFRKGLENIKYLPNEIKNVCEACGWFFTHFLYYDGQNPIVTKEIDYNNEWLMKKHIYMFFRAKFNVEYKEKSVPDLLYHIAPSRVVDKILSKGLIPKANGRQEIHPERVYLYTEKPANWREIANNFRYSGKEQDELYSLLCIDKRKINPNVKFYYDSNTYSKYPIAIYTNEPIPPTAIDVIDHEERKI